MNNYRILLMTLFSVALTTELAIAQPGQWPPRYDNNVATNTHYIQPNQNSFQQPESYRSGWYSNYVNPNYDPYINQKQFKNRMIQQNYNAIPALSNFGLYSVATTPLMPPPSMMTYNPWLPGYGLMPIQNFPLPYFPLPMLNYSGWTY